MAISRLDPQKTALLVVDVQERLLPHMHNAADVLTRVSRLVEGFAVLDLPVVVTEQYRKGLGATAPDLQAILNRPAAAGSSGGTVSIFEKLRFSACVDPVREELARLGVRSVLVCGIESHVCVLQSCLDLAELGYATFVAADAVGSRRAEDQHWAMTRMAQAGVTPTTAESALFELLREAGGPRFKAMLKIVK